MDEGRREGMRSGERKRLKELEKENTYLRTATRVLRKAREDYGTALVFIRWTIALMELPRNPAGGPSFGADCFLREAAVSVHVLDDVSAAGALHRSQPKRTSLSFSV